MKLKTPLLFAAALLAACLVLLGATAPAMASPHAQADDAGATQVWASSVYPAADAPGMMSFVALYPNNNAEVVTLYLTKDAIVETGTWETSDDGAVSLTLTGNQDREYDKPATLTLTLDGDTMSDGVFSYSALPIVTPEEMDAMTSEESASEGAADTETAESGEAAMATPMGNVWVSPVYPAADASGLITVLAQYENGNLNQYSIYLGKGVVSEVGTWEADADQGLTVTVTGTIEEEYSDPSSTTYQQLGETLVDGAFVLSLWPQVTPDQMMAAVDPSGTYVTNVYPSADGAGYVQLLSLYANNNAEQTTVYLTQGAVTEYGVWAEEVDGSLTVTMTGSLSGTVEEAYDSPSATVYDRQGTILQDGVFVLFKLEQITPEMMEAMTTPAVHAVYKSDTLPAADSPGRVITLTLFDGGTLSMTTDFLNDAPLIEEVGTWVENEDGTLSVSITGTPDETYSSPDDITFEVDGDQIVATEYDESMWGSEGLTLTEQPAE